MLPRLVPAIARRLLSSRLAALMFLGAAVLFALPALGPAAADSEDLFIEQARVLAQNDPANSPAADRAQDDPRAAWTLERDIEAHALLVNLLSAYDAGDMPAYFAVRADYEELSAKQAGNGVAGTYAESLAAQLRALSKAGATERYQWAGSAPASLYLVTQDTFVLSPLVPVLPFLATDSHEGYLGYDGSYDYLLWVVILVAVSCAAASLQVRGRLAAQLPASPRRRLFASSVATALVALAAVALVCAPGFLIALARNGFGDLAYPVTRVVFTTVVTQTVGATLLQRAALLALVSLAISLLAHLSASLLDSVVPALLVMIAATGFTLVPGYFGSNMAFQPIAAFLPTTYLDVAGATGAYSSVPLTVDVPQLDFAMGAAVMGATCAALAAVLTLVAPLGAVAGGLPAVCGRILGRGVPAAGSARGSSGFAVAAFAGRAPRAGEGAGSKPGGAGAAGAGAASAGAAGAGAISPETAASFASYTRALFRLALFGPWLYALVAIMSAAFLLPAFFNISPDMAEFSVSRYRDGELKQADAALASGLLQRGSSEAADLQRLRDQLSGFVYGATPADQYRSLAAYERSGAELARVGSPALQMVRSAPVDLMRSEAKAQLLERVAAEPDPMLFDLSVRMPGSFYLSFLYGAVPFVFWLVPSITTALAIAALRTRGSLVQQAPVALGMELAAGCLVASVLALAVLALVVFPGTAVATARNGIGELGYPVVYLQNGSVVSSTVGRAILSGAAVQALASTLAVTMLLAVAQLTRSFRATCVAAAVTVVAAVLAAQASALAPAGGTLSLALGWMPLTYLDVARTVGAAGYGLVSGSGVSALVGATVLSASIPMVLAVCCFVLSDRSRHAAVAARPTIVLRN